MSGAVVVFPQQWCCFALRISVSAERLCSVMYLLTWMPARLTATDSERRSKLVGLCFESVMFASGPIATTTGSEVGRGFGRSMER